MKDNTEHTNYSRLPEWEQRLRAESDALQCTPHPASWEKLDTLLDRPTASGPGRIRWLARTLVAAAAILGLVLAIRQTLLPGDPPAAWTSQEIRDIPPGYFAHYLAAAHELAGYRPVGEGGDSGFGASHPLDHSPVTE
jgi:hypothetical protein